jgi:hypothetical protein
MEQQPLKRFFSSELVRKNLPFILLLILTIVLMLLFRYNKKGISTMIEEGKRNLLSLYTSSLRPLISQTEISEEDLFNFALYQTLPLDKQKNKVLLLSRAGGNQVYEIKSTTYNLDTKNYDSFVKLIGMNLTQKSSADSILNSYKKDIYSCVLANDKDAYAINPKIVKVQQAMLADLVSLSYKVDSKKAEKIFISTSRMNHGELASVINSAKQPASAEYFLITPDTVAKTDLYWDQHKFNNQLKDYEQGKLAASDFSRDQGFKWEIESGTSGDKAKNVSHLPINFKIDHNLSKISIPLDQISRLVTDSLHFAMEEMQKKLRSISIRFPRSKGRPGASVNMVPPIPGMDAVINSGKITEQALKMVGDLNIPKIIEEAMKNSGEYETIMQDSAKMKKIKDKFRQANKKLYKLGMDTLKY